MSEDVLYMGDFINALVAVLEENERLVKDNEFLREGLAVARELRHHGVQGDPVGPNRPNRKKLTKQEVKDIRRAFRGGMKQKDLAENYGVNPATISRTVRGIYNG